MPEERMLSISFRKQDGVLGVINFHLVSLDAEFGVSYFFAFSIQFHPIIS